MKKYVTDFLVMLNLFLPLLGNQINHYSLSEEEKNKRSIIWQKVNLEPFNELLISWDAQRPKNDGYLIETSLLINDEWSGWLKYAWWGATEQYTFKDQQSYPAKTGLAATSTIDKQKASGFRIKVTAVNKALLISFRTLHACTTDTPTHKVSREHRTTNFLNLTVAGLSQMMLETPDKDRICSPTSVTAVIHYLTKSTNPNPLTFMQKVIDQSHSIYGNWIFNTAQAIHELGASWHCYIARLQSFDQILQQLEQGYPVVVSVVGPLPGGARPYDKGHLMVIKGYNPLIKEVLCMDPAFPTNEQTHVSYPLEDFMTAWQKRLGLAYMFYRS